MNLKIVLNVLKIHPADGVKTNVLKVWKMVHCMKVAQNNIGIMKLVQVIDQIL